MKISVNFDIRELVHPDWWTKCGERCADFINCNTGETLEAIKSTLSNMMDKEESVTINDWMWNGRYKSSGLRLPKGIGAEFSSHKGGCGFDLKFKRHTPQEAHLFIVQNQELFPYIIRMEHIDATPTWVHIEISTEKRIGDIKVFKP
jgi:hypothetical protein